MVQTGPRTLAVASSRSSGGSLAEGIQMTSENNLKDREDGTHSQVEEPLRTAFELRPPLLVRFPHRCGHEHVCAGCVARCFETCRVGRDNLSVTPRPKVQNARWPRAIRREPLA